MAQQIFWTSDIHFRHNSILQYTDRKNVALNIEQHDQFMVDAINATVTDNDILYILGDIAHCATPWLTLDLVSKLNGKLHLVKGNHDTKHLDIYKASGLFESVQSELQLVLNKKRIIMYHFPILEWDAGHYGSWMLHGHTHGNLDYAKHGLENNRVFDVSLDASYNLRGAYRPWSFDELDAILSQRQNIEHHGQ